MKFTVVILGAPYSSAASYSAYRFCRALLEQGHQLARLFFYADGVHNGSALTCPPQDELDLQQAWRQLITKHQLDAVVCIAAALRRGVLDAAERDRYAKPADNLACEFNLSGLGQLIEACATCDRTVTFGA
ncbi:sulfurtransferase complex subunit TusD [Gilvimarinus algae]|uniref:Sulfurtransferase complex subunit TusD n=1 Tax=Gilvimarinus algae TaxID=3058037 RepID=A0ABT8TGN5_9GAMM|nr:sulfurtransferase complex subunit TusD [Gilvimarinus sp. SDUM040014]MDO3382288.1 sulfurtransferase complex subunit TusD [Gilvimarinus sp. SDUM040014]